MASRTRKLFYFGIIGVLFCNSFLATKADSSSDQEKTVAARLATLRQKFDFKPIAQEGGYFFSTYHSEIMVPGTSPGAPSLLAGSAIYFLLTPGDFSALHRLKEDEIYHYYTGSPIELLQLFPDGTGSVTICGPEFWNGQQPQVVVKHGTWQGSHPIDPRNYSLLGTTMTPGFTPSDFELGKRDELAKSYPQFAAKIKALTRQ
ncbi:MAG TPA: cupin domain-containing protein [Candidatus Methylacidiphilales bacterium]